MKNRSKHLLLIALFLLTLNSTTAPSQALDECNKFWGAKAVFTGKVVRAYRGESKRYEFLNGIRRYLNTPVLHVTFKVERPFTGFQSGRSLTPVAVECAACLLEGGLQPGESYLVYAYGVGSKGSDPLAMSIPSPVSQASNEIIYLERLTAPGTIAYDLNRIYVGALLSGKALSMPQPTYPDVAKAAGASGPVTVALVLNPLGIVTRAEAVCGDPLLRAASEKAARMIRYVPTKVNGRAVSVGGLVIYDFVRP